MEKGIAFFLYDFTLFVRPLTVVVCSCYMVSIRASIYKRVLKRTLRRFGSSDFEPPELSFEPLAASSEPPAASSVGLLVAFVALLVASPALAFASLVELSVELAELPVVAVERSAGHCCC